MGLATIIYLIGLLDVACAFKFFIPVLTFVAAFLCAAIADFRGGGFKETFRPLKKYLVPAWIVWVVLLFLPSEETAYKMMLAYAGQSVAEMEETKEVGGKAYQALNKLLDDYLAEGK